MQRNDRRISISLGLLLLIASALLSGLASAQTQTTGAITGRVTDTSGAVIPNATVTLTSRATGTQNLTTTDQTGNYRFNLLPPGGYQLRFSSPGFKTEVPADVAVTVTETS